MESDSQVGKYWEFGGGSSKSVTILERRNFRAIFVRAVNRNTLKKDFSLHGSGNVF